MASRKTESLSLSNMPPEIKLLIISFLDLPSIPSMVLLNRDFNKILTGNESQDYVATRIICNRYSYEHRLIQMPESPERDSVGGDSFEEQIPDVLYGEISITNPIVFLLALSRLHKAKEAARENNFIDMSTGPRDPKFWDDQIQRALNGGLQYLKLLQYEVVDPIRKASDFIRWAMSFTDQRATDQDNLYRALLLHWRTILGGILDASNRRILSIENPRGSAVVRMFLLENLPLKDKAIYVNTMSQIASMIRTRLRVARWRCNQGSCPSPGSASRSIHEQCQDRTVLMRLLLLDVDGIAAMMGETFDPNLDLTPEDYFGLQDWQLMYSYSVSVSQWSPNQPCFSERFGRYYIDATPFVDWMMEVEKELVRAGQG